MISHDDLEVLEKALPHMSDKERQRNLALLKDYQKEMKQKNGKANFLDFIKHVYPGYKIGAHHARLAKLFEEIAEGKRKRVIVNIAPRHGKSELISYLAPAWFLGKHPAKKVIMASHTADLAVNFGRRVRNLVGSDAYKDIFPDINCKRIVNRHLDGVRTLMGNILQSVLVVRLLVEARICLLSMTLTQNKMLNWVNRMFSYRLGNGFSPARFSVLCLVVLLLL
jgi:hypothetical protein